MADEKDDRLFAPFSIEMDEHPKIIGISDAAFRALFEGTFYSRRMLTDGFLDRRVVLKRWGQDAADELAANDPEQPSWIPVEHGWQIHDFSKHHPLRAEIMAKRAEVSEKRSEAGKRGAAKRWQKDGKPMAKERQGSGKGVANDSSETQTETETLVSSKELTLTRVPFEAVWSSWPKKTEKDRSESEYLKAVKSHPGLPDDIRRFGAAYAATTEKQFIPALAAWLHRKRWTDELPQPRQGQGSRVQDGLSVADQLREMEASYAGE